MREELSVPIKETISVLVKGYEASDDRIGRRTMVAGKSSNSPELTQCCVEKDQ